MESTYLRKNRGKQLVLWMLFRRIELIKAIQASLYYSGFFSSLEINVNPACQLQTITIWNEEKENLNRFWRLYLPQYWNSGSRQNLAKALTIEPAYRANSGHRAIICMLNPKAVSQALSGWIALRGPANLSFLAPICCLKEKHLYRTTIYFFNTRLPFTPHNTLSKLSKYGTTSFLPFHKVRNLIPNSNKLLEQFSGSEG